jgi:hypothetical protein
VGRTGGQRIMILALIGAALAFTGAIALLVFPATAFGR